MSKALQIRQEIETRLQALGTVRRGRTTATTDQTPLLTVSAEGRARAAENGSGDRFRVAMPLVIEYHDTAGADPDAQGDSMIAAVRAAIESPADRTLGGLLISPGITWAEDTIIYPEPESHIVTVMVTYDADHIDT